MSPRPNILLITADHMRHDALGCNGNPFVSTPYLDSLASRGVTFANSFTPNPICVPARATITTGNYSHICTGQKSNGGRIKDDQLKIAEVFSAAGYATTAVGKLHYVPYSPPGRPRLLHGFDHAELCEEGRIIGQFDPTGKTRGLEDYHDFLMDVDWGGYERAHAVGNNDVHATASPLPAQYHEESWVAARTIANLQQHLENDAERPFFMWASFTKPHSPYDPPQPYDRLYDPRALPPPIGSLDLLADRDPALRSWPVAYGWDKMSPEAVQYSRAHYYGLVTFQDRMVGHILDFLRQAGIEENTIVVYSADHGDLLGDFGCFFKCNMFQGSVGVPLIWAGPGIRPSLPAQQLAGLQDILPTLASLTAVPLDREVQGHNLAPILADTAAPGREFYIAQSLSSPQQRYMVRTARYKYVYHELGGVEELYDVAEDRAELHNLAREKQAIAAQLRAVLTDWCRETGDTEMLDGGDLKQAPENAADMDTFQVGRLGWRQY